jgi:hypothetical protein
MTIFFLSSVPEQLGNKFCFFSNISKQSTDWGSIYFVWVYSFNRILYKDKQMQKISTILSKKDLKNWLIGSASYIVKRCYIKIEK